MTQRLPRNGRNSAKPPSRRASAIFFESQPKKPAQQASDTTKDPNGGQRARKISENLAGLEDGIVWVRDLVNILQRDIEKGIESDARMPDSEIRWRAEEIISNLTSLRIPIQNIQKIYAHEEDKRLEPFFDTPLSKIPSKYKSSISTALKDAECSVDLLKDLVVNHSQLDRLDVNASLYGWGIELDRSRNSSR